MIVHRCKFVEFVPSAITALAVSPAGLHVAVGRRNGDVEVWALRSKCWPILRIPGVKHIAVQSLAWVADAAGTDERTTLPRLFSCGLQGSIVEYDLVRLRVLREDDAFSSSVWCLAVSNTGTMIAVGCDDGVVRVFDVHTHGIDFKFGIPSGGGRIMSVSWSKHDTIIVAGHADGNIRLYNLDSKAVSGRITVGRQVLIWSVLCLPDNTIVSGDSNGNTCFWSMDSLTLQHSFREHQADVLTVAATPDGKTVFSSGMDNRIARFQCIVQGPGVADSSADMDIDHRVDWVYVHSRRPHTHDVAKLCTYIDPIRNQVVLLSGGMDSVFCQTTLQQFIEDSSPQKWLPFPFSSRFIQLISASDNVRLLCSHSEQSVDIWRIQKCSSTTVDGDRPDGTAIPAESDPSRLLQLNVKNASSNIRFVEISPNGRFIVVCMMDSTRIYEVNYSDDFSAVTNVHVRKDLNELLSASHACRFFTQSSSPATTGSNNGNLFLLSLTNRQGLEVISFSPEARVDVRWSSTDSIPRADEGHLPSGPGGRAGDGAAAAAAAAALTMSNSDSLSSSIDEHPVRMLEVDDTGRWAAFVDYTNRITLFDIVSRKIHTSVRLSEDPLTALSFRLNSHRETMLMVVTEANRLLEYDVKNRCLSDWTNENLPRTPLEFLRLKSPIHSILCNTSSPDVVYVVAAEYFAKIDLSKPFYPNAPISNKSAKSAIGCSKITRLGRKTLHMNDGGDSDSEEHHPREANNLLADGTVRAFPTAAEVAQQESDEGAAIRVVRKFQLFLGVRAMDKSELLLVERPWMDVMSSLPDTVNRPRYGT